MSCRTKNYSLTVYSHDQNTLPEISLFPDVTVTSGKALKRKQIKEITVQLTSSHPNTYTHIEYEHKNNGTMKFSNMKNLLMVNLGYLRPVPLVTYFFTNLKSTEIYK